MLNPNVSFITNGNVWSYGHGLRVRRRPDPEPDPKPKLKRFDSLIPKLKHIDTGPR